MRSFPPEELYYIAHIDNLGSILEKGILSHEKMEQLELGYTSIYNEEIVSRRRNKSTPDSKSLWHYANLYFQPRNPMMYSIVSTRDKENLVVISISKEVLGEHGVLITDGNAANAPTQFYSQSDGLKILKRQWNAIRNDWWNKDDGSKRKIMAECLVPDSVNSKHINSLFVVSTAIGSRVKQIVDKRQISVIPEPHMFFQPGSRTQIGDNISLVDGDMFFSTMQTLTISVNLQGVMGKGLASRAKYQFPDVYVGYQDACRARKITARRPYLYKRETSLDQELADPGLPLSTPNAVKWFLLFATKRRWRDDSRLDDIEGGLDWVKKNYKKEKIESLAMPALGCGLGNLSWTDVGPLMCKYLHGIEIPVAIYLPREHKIDSQYLTESYLLGDRANRSSSSTKQLAFF
ncbi:MAG: DarT ssDNA thymidine ADP-ribosyltransferase family protein [Candidatus Poribacteria bacterium]|nr:DarT ssDNA thymidine ADP-ribosyltransferase family protein [Candidatus Poribacteria bacterium]